METHDPIEPTEPEPFETDEARNTKARADAAASARPDWLVGADDGVEAELERTAREREAPTSGPTLNRPAPASEDPARPAGGPLRLVPGGKPAAAAPKAPEKPVAWTAAASSLPTLRVVSGGPSATPAGRETRGAPEARTSVDARFAPENRPAPDARMSVDARFTPDARFAPVARTAPPPARANDLDEDAGFPDDAGPAPPAPVARAATPAVRVAPRREAWWLIAIDALREDRKVQILAGLVVLLIAVIVFWPRSESTVALSEIHRHPQAWNAKSVRVSGRVGEVFQVGGGYAFYLHQGRDTLVVFTRSRTPQTNDHLSISGTISTGWLDGLPREALFEGPPK